MAQACPYCGTVLEEGKFCNCQQAVQARTSAKTANPFPQTNAQQEWESSQAVALMDPPAEEPESQSPPQAGQIIKEKLQSVDYRGIFHELIKLLMGILRDPVVTAQNARHLSRGVSFAALGVQVITFLILVLGLWAKVGLKMSIKVFFYPILLMASEIALLFGTLFLLGKVFRNPMGIYKVLGVVALGAPLWGVNFLLCFVVVLVFGAANIGGYLLLLLMTFTLVYSLYLLETGVRSQVPHTVKHVHMLALAFAVKTVVWIAFVGLLIRDGISSALFYLL